MADDINSFVGTGNLTRDAELKYTNSGTAIVKFSIASNRSVKKGDSWHSEASFFDVTMMGKLPEKIHQYLTKGKPVTIHGELRQDRWESENGPRTKVYIFATDIKLHGSAESGNSRSSSNQGDSGYSGVDEEYEDDIPF